MPQPRKSLRICATLALFTGFLPPLSRAGTWVAFRNSYTRGTGAPVTVTNTFTLLNPATQYTLKAFNGGLQNSSTELVSNSFVLLNGIQVIGPSDFSQSVAEVNVTIFPGLTNTVSVQVRGQPGGVLSVQVIGVDNDPPTITASVSPSPNAAGWNNSPVTVTFTCSDKTSGVASCPSPVTVSTEGANQVVSGTATDLAGNTATTSVTINLDMTPPTISGTINPPPDAGGYNSGPVTVTFTCADALSGVASCSPPVSVSGEGSFPETGTAVDVAGNTATTTVTVNISLSYFKIRSWQTNPAGDPSQTGKCLDYGATIFLNDCPNAHPIRVVEVPEFTFPDGQICQFEDGQTPPTCFHHEVVLYAGNLVIGIHNPPANTLGGPPPPISPQAEYALELQSYNPNLATTRNQIFALDGDSIILESSRPYVSTTGTGLCPPAFMIPDPSDPNMSVCATRPPQFVVQVQNARGTNGSPLVVSLRNLADNEFWDFVPSPGSRPYPTTGFISMIAPPGAPPSSATPITTNWQLWNAICTPQVEASIGSAIIAGSMPPQPLLDYTVQPPVAVAACSPNVGWGSVVVIADSDPNECTGANIPAGVGPCIDLSAFPPITLPFGVTIRGNRRSKSFGPQLFEQLPTAPPYKPNPVFWCGACMLEVRGDYVRVTGLRMRGQSRSTDQSVNPASEGLNVDFPGQPPGSPAFPPTTQTELIATIDHNDMSDWGAAAIGAGDAYTAADPIDNDASNQSCTFSVTGSSTSYPCNTIADDSATLANVRVARNFLHHNERDNDGYGVGVGRALIDGNTFVSNRHAISGGGEPHNEYIASHNLVLSRGVGGNQDFDMHGINHGTHGDGGPGGFYVNILGNTFLGIDRQNYWLRGNPIINTDFDGNVSLRNVGDAIHFLNGYDSVIGDLCCTHTYPGPPFPINLSGNQFADSIPPSTNPTAQLGVGDFDGNGDDDLFLATGNTWFYSPGGAREWRYLNSAPDTIDQLLFGDFDGDGRTDVVALRNGQLWVSWGGISALELLNNNNNTPLPCSSMSDMAVGDFDGDGKPDIFCADGNQWWISYGGTSAFVKGAPYNLHGSALLFGDFDGDGTTDVFAVVSGGWYYSKGGTGQWADGPLQTTALPTTNGNALTIGDFNGDGIPDVATLCTTGSGGGWQISYSGTQPWTPCTPFASSGLSYSLVNGPVGHFSGGKGADILLWNGNGIWSFPGGTGPAQPLSSQDMR